MAPEILDKGLKSDRYSFLEINSLEPSESLWSLGVTFFEVGTLAGSVPYADLSDGNLLSLEGPELLLTSTLEPLFLVVY